MAICKHGCVKYITKAQGLFFRQLHLNNPGVGRILKTACVSGAPKPPVHVFRRGNVNTEKFNYYLNITL